MPETVTIMFKDYPPLPRIVNLSSLSDFPVETKTINPKSLRVMFDIGEMYEIDDEMRDLENAAMVDFLRFEEAD